MKKFDLNNKEITVLQNPLTLKVYTKSPKKWFLIDSENGHLYQGSNNQESMKNWKKIKVLDNLKFI